MPHFPLLRVACSVVFFVGGSIGRAQSLPVAPKSHAEGADHVRQDPAAWVPANTLILVDMLDGSASLKALLRSLGPWPQEASAKLRRLPDLIQLGVGSTTGMALDDLLEAVAPAEACFALVAGEEPYPVWVSRLTQEVDEDDVLDVFDRLRGKAVTDLSDGFVTVTTKPAHLREVLEVRRGKRPMLLSRKGFETGRSAFEPGGGIRIWADPKALYGISNNQGTTPWAMADGGTRFLFGPLMQAYSAATRLDGVLRFTADGLAFDVRIDASIMDAQHPARLLLTTAERQLLPVPETALGVLSIDRTFTGLFDNLEKLMSEDDAVGAKSFLSTFDQLVGQGSFLDDILRKVTEPLTLMVIARDEEETGWLEMPGIWLPSFVLVAKLDDTRAQGMLERAAGVFAFIINNERAMQRKGPFRLRITRVDGFKLMVARPPDWRGEGKPPLDHALSPTLLFTDGHVILSSTIDGAVAVARGLGSASGRAVSGDYIELDGEEVAAYIDKNIGALTLNKVFEEGLSEAEADEQFANFALFSRVIKQLTIRIRPGKGETSISIRAVRLR